MSDFTIRPAVPDDAALILALLRELADYEHLQAIFATSEAAILRDFFGPQAVAQCDLAMADGEAVGLATFFWTYGSFTTARGIFVEDLFVRPAFRGRGYGKALLAHLAAKGADRMDWLVLDWNESAMDFYRKLGARRIEGWLPHRVEGDALKKLGAL